MGTLKAPSATDRVTARRVDFDETHMFVQLTDGRTITVPVNTYRRLREATAEQRGKWELIGRGTGIHWEEIDEDLSIAGLLRDFGAVAGSSS
jgi:hypothetical protein